MKHGPLLTKRRAPSTIEIYAHLNANCACFELSTCILRAATLAPPGPALVFYTVPRQVERLEGQARKAL